MPDDLTGLDDSELERRISAAREQMRPLELDLGRLRGDRDVLLTERRRRERTAHRQARADVKAQMKEGALPTLADLVAGAEGGSLDGYIYNLKTGGEVRLGFPSAGAQTIAFTDGVQTSQATDLADASRLYAAGWELGSPGRPGVRIHFPGTRQERLVPADDVFARSRDISSE